MNEYDVVPPLSTEHRLSKLRTGHWPLRAARWSSTRYEFATAAYNNDLAAVGRIHGTGLLDINQPDPRTPRTGWAVGETVLHWAAMGGATEAVAFLVANGADVAASTSDGRCRAPLLLSPVLPPVTLCLCLPLAGRLLRTPLHVTSDWLVAELLLTGPAAGLTVERARSAAAHHRAAGAAAGRSLGLFIEDWVHEQQMAGAGLAAPEMD